VGDGVTRRASARLALLVAVAALLLLVAGCGGGQRSSHRPEELLGAPPAGATYKVPDATTLKRLVGIVQNGSNGIEPRDVAARLVMKNGVRAGAVVVLDTHGGDRDATFTGFEKEARSAGAEATSRRVSGAEVRQAELTKLVATLAVEHGFALETIAPDRSTGELLMRPLLERAAALSD
jgi:hypothetical protein